MIVPCCNVQRSARKRNVSYDRGRVRQSHVIGVAIAQTAGVTLSPTTHPTRFEKSAGVVDSGYDLLDDATHQNRRSRGRGFVVTDDVRKANAQLTSRSCSPATNIPRIEKGT
jgi:hypothetical protein